MSDKLTEVAATLAMEHQAGHNLRLPTEVVLIGFFRVWGNTRQDGYEMIWGEIKKTFPRTCAKIDEWIDE